MCVALDRLRPCTAAEALAYEYLSKHNEEGLSRFAPEPSRQQSFVDDILWAADEQCQDIIDRVLGKFDIREVKTDTFRYCGLRSSQDEEYTIQVIARFNGLAGPELAEDNCDYVYPVYISSKVTRRVCEPILRVVVTDARGLLGDGTKLRPDWEATSATTTQPVWLTDCKDLEEHLKAPTMGKTEDRQSSIDLHNLRQDLWTVDEDEAEMLHDTRFCDKVRWISTSAMLVDYLCQGYATLSLMKTSLIGSLGITADPGIHPQEGRGRRLHAPHPGVHVLLRAAGLLRAESSSYPSRGTIPYPSRGTAPELFRHLGLLWRHSRASMLCS